MIAKEILWDEAGVLWLGREGQDTYGRKNFLDLISVFTSPPLFTVLHGRRELGFVDESTFLAKREDGPPVLLLAGRAWRVGHLDWKRRRAYVEPAEDVGRSRWRGEGQFLSRELCGAIRRTLAGDEVSPRWSARAAGASRPSGRVPLAEGGRRECPRHLGRRHRLVDLRRRPGQRRARPRAGSADRRPGHVRQLRGPVRWLCWLRGSPGQVEERAPGGLVPSISPAGLAACVAPCSKAMAMGVGKRLHGPDNDAIGSRSERVRTVGRQELHGPPRQGPGNPVIAFPA